MDIPKPMTDERLKYIREWVADNSYPKSPIAKYVVVDLIAEVERLKDVLRERRREIEEKHDEIERLRKELDALTMERKYARQWAKSAGCLDNWDDYVKRASAT